MDPVEGDFGGVPFLDVVDGFPGAMVLRMAFLLLLLHASQRMGFSAFRVSVILLYSSAALGLLLASGRAEDDVISPDATVVTWDFARWCQVGPQRFTLEKTTLKDVVRVFDGGTITRDGVKGAEVFNWLVRYRWGDQVITFSSNNDMGGDTHDLEGVDIGPVSEVSDATKLPLIHGPITFPFGEPGMSFLALERGLGRSRLNKGNAEYRYQNQRPPVKNSRGFLDVYDTTGWLRVKIVGEKVERITLDRVTEGWEGTAD